MSFILALDQGTTSSRAIVFEHGGAIRATAQKEFQQIFPQTGWVEHNPRELWSSQVEVAHAALARAGLKAGDLAAIGITNQRETTVLWDRSTGEPIHNAIVWQDRRTAGFCDELKQAGHEELIRRKAGLVIDAYFSGSKVRWLLDHVPGARERARHGELAFGTIDSWLLWNLTGGELHLTDPSNASRTMLFNLQTGTWDEELLRVLDVLAKFCRRCAPPANSMAKPLPVCSMYACRLPVWRATSKPPCSVRTASAAVWQKTLTELAVSC